MKKLIKITILLLAGLMVSANVSAYYVDGSDVRLGSSGSPGAVADGTYLGDMGNVHNGLPHVTPNLIGTHYISDGAGGYTYQEPAFPSNGVTGTHWYYFSSNGDSLISGIYEFGSSITSFVISFFKEGSDSDFYTKTFSSSELTAGFFNDLNFAGITAGGYLMKIVGTAQNGNSSYRVRLAATTPVPLPPAALLFISALAGFGVIGRKKARTV